KGVPKRYGNIASFVSHTVREAGPTGLFRGMSPALAMVAPQMGIGFAVYEFVKANPPALLTGASSVRTTAWPLVAGAAAGMTSKLAVFPLDTVKKRVQTEVNA
ncbi:unnamed protein product, partial [Laminaria digitata]